MNGKSLGRSTKSRALSTRVQNISNQLATLSKQISPTITLTGRNAVSLGNKKTLTIHRRVMTRFVADTNGFGSFGMIDIGLPSTGVGQPIATPLKIKIMGAPLQFLQVSLKPSPFSINAESTVGFPTQEQVKICPATLAPSSITMDIPDAFAPMLVDINKLFDVNTGPSQAIYIQLTYCQVIQA